MTTRKATKKAPKPTRRTKGTSTKPVKTASAEGAKAPAVKDEHARRKVRELDARLDRVERAVVAVAEVLRADRARMPSSSAQAAARVIKFAEEIGG